MISLLFHASLLLFLSAIFAMPPQLSPFDIDIVLRSYHAMPLRRLPPAFRLPPPAVFHAIFHAIFCLPLFADVSPLPPIFRCLMLRLAAYAATMSMPPYHPPYMLFAGY